MKERYQKQPLPERASLRKKSIALLAAPAIFLAGCSEQSAVEVKLPPSNEQLSPGAPTVALVGDSLSVNAFGLDSSPILMGDAPAHFAASFANGRTIGDNIPFVDLLQSEQVPDVLIVDTITNNADTPEHKWGENDIIAGDGFNQRDVDELQRIVDVSKSRNIILVKPGYSQSLDTVPGGIGFQNELLKASDAIDDVAQQYPDRVTVVDRQEVIDAAPSLIEQDGIHLARSENEAVDPAAALQFQQMLWVKVAELTSTPPK